ncbi:MAG: PD-(D/E)XK nuclease family protein [Proteobacteria bacterium]|nr:PD-(D/E)XK nuclease family protein [Pseudomonadota bacterium]
MFNKSYNAILCNSENQAHDIQLTYKSHKKNTITQLPLIQLIDRWLIEKYMDYCMVNPVEKAYKVLNGVEEKFIWEKIIRDHLLKNKEIAIATSGIDDLCKMAINANRLITEHLISEEELNENITYKETRFFSEWRNIFIKFCTEKNLATKYNLTRQCIDLINRNGFVVNEDLYIIGLDEKKPLYESLILNLSKKNNVIRHESTLNPKANVTVQSYDTYDDEIYGIIGWIKNKHKLNQRRLLIMTPALDYLQNKIQSAINREIQPNIYESLDNCNIVYSSLRRPLSVEPIIRAAYDLIRLNEDRPISIKTFNELLLFSNWVDNDGFEDRQKFGVYLLKLNRPEMTLRSIIHLMNNDPKIKHLNLTTLSEVLNICVKNQKKWTTKRKISTWSSLVEGYLSSINWSNINNLLSFEINSINNLYNVFNEVNLSIMGKENFSFNAYLERFFYYLENFVPRQFNIDATIDLYGYHENPLKDYDAVWLSNMNDNFWPGKVEYNPFIPKILQNKYHIYDADYINKIHKLVQFRLTSATAELQISYCLKDKDASLRPSPGLGNAIHVKKNPINNTVDLSLSQELIDDSYAEIIEGEIHINSGRSCLEKQKKCPAWAFYEHRLGCRQYDTDEQDTVSRRAEGQLIHKALEIFWLNHKSSNMLIQMSEKVLKNEINEVVNCVIGQYITDYPNINPTFVSFETEHLQETLFNWLIYEKNRPPFTVVACEKPYQIKVGRISFTIQVDRIDKLHYGSNLLIDYKTGNAPPSRKSLFSKNNLELQLPIYAGFSGIENLSGVAIGWINRKNNNLYGVTSHSTEVITRNLHGKIDSTDINCWQDLVDNWVLDLERVANDYLSGNASVTFIDGEAFDYCKVLPLLRLAEKKYQFEHYEY